MKESKSGNIKSSNTPSKPFFLKGKDDPFFQPPDGKTKPFFSKAGIQTKLKNNQTIQKKCNSCEEEGLQAKEEKHEGLSLNEKTIQRKSIFESNDDVAEETIQKKSITELSIQKQEDTPLQNTDAPAGRFIVNDQDTPGPGQMTKTTFLNQLNQEVCQATEEGLSGTPFTSKACPYIQRSFARHRKSSPGHIEKVLQRYDPQSSQATSASELISMIRRRTHHAVKQWKETGDLSGVPSEIATKIPGSLTMMARAMNTIGNIGSEIVSGISSVGSAITSGVGSMLSGIGNMFFKSESGGAQATQSPESVMSSLGTGQSLDSKTRGNMEGAFGSSFSNVQIHTDANAAALSRDMNAKAFAVGNHVAFGSGEYQPGNPVGDALIAHELAHVQQQSGGTKVQQKTEQGEVNKLEKEADQSALEAVSGMYGIGQKGMKSKLSRSGLQLRSCGDGKSKKPPTTKEINKSRMEYAQLINKSSATTKGGDEGLELARALIGDWKTGAPYAILNYDMKLNLIRELLKGGPSESDQGLILKLIEDSEVVHTKKLIGETFIQNAVKDKFSADSKKAFDKIKTGRAKQAVTSGGSFHSEYVRDLIDKAYANALLKKGAGRKECITTVRKISLTTLYQHLSEAEQKKLESTIDKECKSSNTMLEAMEGIEKAGYSGPEQKFPAKKTRKEIDITVERGTKKVKFNSSYFPGPLKKSVWGAINAKTSGKEGWHAFGLGIMDSFHSVILMVNVRPGGPFLYFVDQNNRERETDTKHRKKATIPGVQQFIPSQLDAYLTFYSELNYEGYMQNNINQWEKNNTGKSVKESDLSKRQPNSHMSLWNLKTKK